MIARTVFFRFPSQRRPSTPLSPTALTPNAWKRSTQLLLSRPQYTISKISSVFRSVRRLTWPEGEVMNWGGCPSCSAMMFVVSAPPCTTTIR